MVGCDGALDWRWAPAYAYKNKRERKKPSYRWCTHQLVNCCPVTAVLSLTSCGTLGGWFGFSWPRELCVLKYLAARRHSTLVRVTFFGPLLWKKVGHRTQIKQSFYWPPSHAESSQSLASGLSIRNPQNQGLVGLLYLDECDPMATPLCGRLEILHVAIFLMSKDHPPFPQVSPSCPPHTSSLLDLFMHYPLHLVIDMDGKSFSVVFGSMAG